ncbi:MAG: hypothetical protein AB8G16_10100 [Gammaproteobacteria bacterium]
MTQKKLGLYVALALVLGTAVLSSRAQVDPEWLKSWIEARQAKPDAVHTHGRISSADEPGIAMMVRGQIKTPNESPAAGVLVHAYHRDHHGLEYGAGDKALTTWRLNGWARTDANGRFEFETIRPAPDHLGREAAHIHFTLVSEAFGRQWAPKVFFSDDPLVTKRQRRESDQAGEYGAVREVRTEDGVQYVRVMMRLKEQGDF